MKHTILFFIILISTISYSQTSVEEDWTLHFPQVLDYESFGINKMANDNQGNLYLLGFRQVSGVNQSVIIKIIRNSFVVEWFVYFGAAGYEYASANDLEIDDLGNCYVAGSGRTDNSSHNDFITTKYNPLGQQVWASTYNGAINQDDWIDDLFIDNSGNAYVTGASFEINDMHWNATTIKYNSDGVMQWKATYVDSNIYNDEGKGIVVDNSGNVYVVGQTTTTTLDFLTIKYNSAGVEEWNNIYGSGALNEYAQFIGLDNSGKITVGGTAYDSNLKGYLIYKFNSDGSYIGSGNNYNSPSEMRGMVVSPTGNVFVTGSNGDYSTVKFNSSGNFQWERRYNGGLNDYPNDIKIDSDENVYVTGSSNGVSSSIALTIKYNSSGDSLWSNIYTHQNFPYNYAQEIILDDNGEMYVAIHYYAGSSEGNELIKLNNSGVYQWAYNYKSFCQPTSIKEDTQGNIYLTGFGGREQSMWDYITMKCDSSGNILWLKTYDGPANGAEQASDLEIDNLGNVYVTGGSNGIGTDYDFATIKYDPSGNEQWVVRYNSPAFGSDIASYMSVDQDGNVYVSGSSINSNSTFDIATIKYNNLGQLQWVKRYNGTADGNDFSQGLEVDQSGNVFIAGTSDSTGTVYDYVTVKYNASGNTEWVKKYNGPANDGDLVSSMSLDNSGNVYTTGWSFGTTTNSDYATVKYNSIGSEQWSARWDDPASSFDYANDIAVDENGNVYVTGISQGMGTDNDYTTVKYNSIGQQQWAVPYNGNTNGSDIGSNIVLDYLGDVYVTGHTDNNIQYSTIKYDQQGVLKWTINYDYSNYQDTPTDLIVDNSGNVTVAGYSSQPGEEWIWSIAKYKQPGFVPSEVKTNTIPPTEFILYQNYPNPFNPFTTLKYSIPASSYVNLKIYDILGEEVATIVNEENVAGEYEIIFDASQLTSGIYFYRLQAGEFSSTRKLILIK
jgi:uncharacterized delta-60 repeat protein